MRRERSNPVAYLPRTEPTERLEGDEDWLTTLDDPHDTTTETTAAVQPTQRTT